MDFTLSEDQELLRDTARQLLARECPTTLLRAHIDDPTAADPLWRHLKDFAALGDGPSAWVPLDLASLETARAGIGDSSSATALDLLARG